MINSGDSGIKEPTPSPHHIINRIFI